jgi:hypothetical protein
MIWYKKVLIENKNEIISSATSSIIVTFAFSLWYFITGKAFEWKEISPISQPSLLYRELYSALVFVTVGAFLYYVVRLWQILYFIFVTILESRELYRLIKAIIWISLILSMYFYVVPVVVNLLNRVISFFYNLTMLLMYSFPVICIFVIVFMAVYLMLKKSSKL